MSTPKGNPTARAVAAWYRTWTGEGTPPQPTEARSVTHDGKQYVVLTNPTHGVLAVYRVRRYDAVLKRMKRWPAEIEEAQS